jgi:hypothetical protein
VHSGKLEDAVTKFLSKKNRTERSNVPQKHTAIDKETRKKIMLLQQLHERVARLAKAKDDFPDLSQQIENDIKGFESVSNYLKKKSE